MVYGPSKVADEPILYALARPRRFSQECEAGFDGGVVAETADGNAAPQHGPAMALYKLVQDAFQRNTVQGVFGVFIKRCHGL